MGWVSFFRDLKSRNVLKAALAYVIFSWVTIQVATILFTIFNVSQFWLQFVVIMLIVGLGVWLVLSWHFDIGATGIRLRRLPENPETGSVAKASKANYIILWTFSLLFVIISLVIYAKMRPTDGISKNIEAGYSNAAVEKSVAVLAFLDLSPAKDNEYFSDGISEEILNYLSKNNELRVISRTSSFSFKGKNMDIKTIGEQLNANYILEGSVRRADSNLRITVQLIRASDGVHLWSETYSRKMADVFAIQDEIAKEVTYKLQASLLGEKIEKTDVKAYTAYLQAKSLALRYTKEGAETGLTLIDQSLAIDSAYAPAWLLKSKLHFQDRVYSNNLNALAESQRAAQKAVTLDPEYAEAYAWLGRFNVINSNFPAAYSNFQKALSLNAENSVVLRNVSTYPSIALEDRIEILKKAQRIDPLDPSNYRLLSIYYFFQSNFQEALESLDTYLVYQPFGNGDHGLRGEILAWLGCKDEAIIEIEQEEDAFSKTYSSIMVSLVLNLENAALEIEGQKEIFEDDQPYLLAQMYAVAGNKERAFHYLEKALNVSDYDMYFQMQSDPYMSNIKDEERFKGILKRMKIPKTLVLHLNAA
ncbi:tetratricopeptide repeat protein [Constantimarinum furrinae]|uniref:Uncharacterized protein n=1 Tax=Constantimarinum furrinae TaxID=2562285 RepID=A0A7G8PTH3_9FLAO|nr:hypothetical protein [Constantimarinum furrinae]QNJ97639.1 hypothetical protein ALE3EI_1066 [Constantimarinum furrinae]